ncbi:MAG: hypothetical protein HYS19_02375 [Nitrosomonadales bacterium]|nr:hypothetical protein [Nitrosomonadales bacterium]
MITLITGVPGTGKTVFVVSELEKEISKGRIVLTNIRGLKLPHYRIGAVSEWQKGTWLHIDRYIRRSPSLVLENPADGEIDFWESPPDVIQLADSGECKRLVFDKGGEIVGSVDYESHKGALLVIDECQDHFRGRPAGSAVPDHVAALEVHRHQGLDIWLITQRPGLIDSNVRSLVGRHIALRSTSLGRYKYEWPEAGDIESKFSRDTAARTRYRLPKHVFGLYKSADVHTTTKHSLPFAAKALFFVVPLLGLLLFSSYRTVAAKTEKVSAGVQSVSALPVLPVAAVSPGAQPDIPAGFEPYSIAAIEKQHPFERSSFRITGRLTSMKKDVFSFAVSGAAGVSSYMTSEDLSAAGYTVVSVNDCSVKLIYKAVEFFVTCVDQSQQILPVLPYPVAAAFPD